MTRRDKFANSQESGNSYVVVIASFGFRLSFSLAFGTTLFDFLFILVLIALCLSEFFFHSLLFFSGAFARKRNSVFTYQLHYRLTMRNRKNFKHLDSFLLYLALAVYLAGSLLLDERIFGETLLQFVLIERNLAEERLHIQSLGSSGRIEGGICNSGVV